MKLKTGQKAPDFVLPDQTGKKHSLKTYKGKKVVKAYGVWGKKKFMGREYMGTNRTSFLIDAQGKISKIYEQVKPVLHAGHVLDDYSYL